jgi:enoyl-[acyl-carrier protein] reductase I
MADLMKGKRGLVMGVANDRSIAWGIASALRAEGAELAFSYQGEAFGKRVAPLAAAVGSDLLVDVDVTDEASPGCLLCPAGGSLGQAGFPDPRHRLFRQDRTHRPLHQHHAGNFLNSLNISCFSFIDVARRAAALMPDGGSLITLTFQGSNRVAPNYNVMGVAKAALESATRYLANDLGPQKSGQRDLAPGR